MLISWSQPLATFGIFVSFYITLHRAGKIPQLLTVTCCTKFINPILATGLVQKMEEYTPSFQKAASISSGTKLHRYLATLIKTGAPARVIWDAQTVWDADSLHAVMFWISSVSCLLLPLEI